MVFYLKVNRNEKYTYRNLQHWVDVMELMPESQYYILCDNPEVKQAIPEQVRFSNSDVKFLKSYKSLPKLNELVPDITDDIWRNAGYAHITTFWHARENSIPYFWNIDADDTYICLSPERICEMLHMVEGHMQDKKIHAMSLDMWNTKSGGEHWSFGITYIDNTIDWYGTMKRYCHDEKLKSKQMRNVDGYFSCLRACTDLKLETFYFENLRFIHYADDFFKRPHASGFYHWKEGYLVLPILFYCFGMEDFGRVPLAEGIIGFDMDITDEESREAMLNNALPDEKKMFELK